MANIITQFLIALGFDTSDLNRGEREVNRSLGSLRTSVTATGAAMSAAFIGIGKITLDTAERVNQLRLNTNTLNSSVTFVNDYGNAIRSLGGNADDAVSEITRVEDALMKLRTRGDASTFTELAYAGVDVKPLENAESGEQFMAELAKQFPQLDRPQQMSVQQTLGLSPASVELLRKGADGYRDIFQHVNDVAGLSPELVKSAQDYNVALTETQLKWEGIKNIIAESVLPDMTSIVEKGGQILQDVIEPMAKENPVATGAGLSMMGAGVTGAVAAPLLGAAGMTGAAALAGAAAPPVALIGVGTLAWNMDKDDVKNLSGVELPDWLFKPIGDLVGDDDKNLSGVELPDWLFKPIGDLVGDDDNKPIGDLVGHDDNKPIEKTKSLAEYSQGYMRQVQSNSFGPLGNQNENTPSLPYAPSTMSREYNPNQSAANSTGRAVADQLRTTPIQVKSTVQNNLTVELDGRALETKIKDVTQRENQMTVDDLRSTTAR